LEVPDGIDVLHDDRTALNDCTLRRHVLSRSTSETRLIERLL